LQPVASEVQPPNGDSESQPGLQVKNRQVVEVPLQVMSHAHDTPQTTLRHDESPVHATLHGPAPQLTFLQLCAPLHAISHDLLLVQSMPLRHELSVEHAMLQFHPAGHTICRLHAPLLSAQSILQVFMSLLQDVHCGGQAGGCASGFTPESTGITQSPSVQVRPARQSDCCVHAKSPLW
jgi:hypothetical protein